MNGEPQPPQPSPTLYPNDIPFARPMEMSYATPTTNTRPGLVTAIGVISIVIGVFGILANGASFLQSAAFLTIGSIGINTTNTTTTVTAPATQPVGGQFPPINPTQFAATLSQANGNAIKPAAQAALATMMADTTKNIAPPGTTPAQVVVALDGSGGGSFTFPGGAIVTVSGDGTSTSYVNFSTGFAGGGPNPFGNMNRGALGVGMVLSLALLGVAIFLLVAGILTLRNNLRARRLHWTYVWLKIPLELLSMGAWTVVYSDMFSTVTSTANGTSIDVGNAMSTGFAIMAAVQLIFYLAYPLTLMFLLRARSVVDFYRADPAPPLAPQIA